MTRPPSDFFLFGLDILALLLSLLIPLLILLPPDSQHHQHQQARIAVLCVFVVASCVSCVWFFGRMAKKILGMASAKNVYDPQTTDPPLLDRNSEIKSYTTSRFIYPNLRVFYRRHQQADKLPKSPAPVPLLVFIHGLGGSVAQFNALLTSLTPVASCLAVDLPGCGRSEFVLRRWDAYTTDALVELLAVVIEDYRDREGGQGVVLLAHSMGCSLAALLANPRAKKTDDDDLSRHVVGLVAICPNAETPSEQQASLVRKLLWIPEPLFDLWRAWDRRGGPQSASVRRFVGADADDESKRLQDLYNNQSKTPVFRRMASGMMPVYENGVPRGGLPGKEVWAGLNLPIFLVGGTGDHVTPPENVDKIAAYLAEGAAALTPAGTDSEGEASNSHPVDNGGTPAAQQKKTMISEISADDFARSKQRGDESSSSHSSHSSSAEDPITPHERPPAIPPQPAHPKKVVETKILPRPATHALLYMPATARVLAGLVSDFLESRVTGRLALGWQLQHLCQEGKWDVKNLEKWKKVAPVSEAIAGGVFRAVKTLREVDDTHSPREFTRKWAHAIRHVVDISHDNPVYDPQGLERGGIKYHKFPTVSKVPPSEAEIRGFIALVDEIRAGMKQEGEQEREGEEHAIGVHCHYGFNRTGFFIACYLVERCGYSVGQAIEAFARARPNGIKHEHFKDRLYVLYSGLGRED